MRTLQVLSVLACLTLAGCSSMQGLEKAWGMVPFGKERPQVSRLEAKRSYLPMRSLAPASYAVTSPVANGWLASVHSRMSQAMIGTGYQVEWRGNAVAVIAPISTAFNPDRPAMLLPASLRPLTTVAKMAAAEPGIAVLILGQADEPDRYRSVQGLATQRAANIASIFRLSGMTRDQVEARGVIFTPQEQMQVDRSGRVLGRRVEMLLVPRDQLVSHMLSYNR